jgi:hypothetical protein
MARLVPDGRGCVAAAGHAGTGRGGQNQRVCVGWRSGGGGEGLPVVWRWRGAVPDWQTNRILPRMRGRVHWWPWRLHWLLLGCWRWDA